MDKAARLSPTAVCLYIQQALSVYFMKCYIHR